MKRKPDVPAPRPVLAPAPPRGRARQLWLQHAAGTILFADVRGYAIKRLDERLDAKTREAAIRAINDTLYGMMMVAEGVSGRLANEKATVAISMSVRLEENGKLVERVDLAEGDGACMGFHGWLEGNFGAVPVVVPPTAAKTGTKSRKPTG